MLRARGQEKKFERCLFAYTTMSVSEKRQLDEERGQTSLGPCREALRQVLYQKAVDFRISKKRKRGRSQGKALRVIKHQPDLLLLPPCIISLTFPLLSCCPRGFLSRGLLRTANHRRPPIRRTFLTGTQPIGC